MRKIFTLVLVAAVIVAGLVFVFRTFSQQEAEHQKVFAIAFNNSWAPLNLLGKEPNMLAFATELMTEVGEMEQIRFSMSTLNNANLFERLDGGYFDGILATITPDSYLREQYSVSDPIYQAGPVLIVSMDSNAKGLKDIQGRGIGIQKNSPVIFQLNQMGVPLLVSYDNMIKALDDLENGSLAGVIMDAQLAYTYTSGFYKGKLKVVTTPLTEVGIHLVSHKDKTGEFLIERFNEGLKKLKASGAYDSMIDKWNLHL